MRRTQTLVLLVPLLGCASDGPPPPDPATIGDPTGLEQVGITEARAFLAPGLASLNGARPLWLSPVEVRYRDGVTRNAADLDVDWGRQALRSALLRELERSGFTVVPRSVPGGMQLDIVVHGVDPDRPRSRPVVLQGTVRAVDGGGREALVVVAPPGGSSGGGMLSFWGEGQSDIGEWAREVVQALVQLRDGVRPATPGAG